MDSQKSQANAACKASYVGRQKAACEMGVTAAADSAKANDGKTYAQKYQVAVGKCSHLEPQLSSACVQGVEKFKTEIAKLDASAQKSGSRKVASYKKAKSASSRAPASK